MQRTVRQYLLDPLLIRNPITVQALTVIAYFQSFWSDDIYERWQTIDSR